MTELSAQVSLYPLGQEDLSPAIDEALRVFKAHGLQVEVGAMSTLLTGDETALFTALRDAAAAAMHLGPAVMVVTISNACAVPEALPGEALDPTP